MCQDVTDPREDMADDVLADEEADEATPVCPHCLEPIAPNQYYCGKCGESVGQLTGILPFINIRFQALFIGALWRKAWHDRKTPAGIRIFCGIIAFLLFPPVMLIALPFVLWEKCRSHKAPEEG